MSNWYTAPKPGGSALSYPSERDVPGCKRRAATRRRGRKTQAARKSGAHRAGRSLPRTGAR